MPNTVAIWNGSMAAHCWGYGDVDGLSGLARSGSNVSGHSVSRVVATTRPALFLMVRLMKFFSPFQPSRTLAGSGLVSGGRPGWLMTWVMENGASPQPDEACACGLRFAK